MLNPSYAVAQAEAALAGLEKRAIPCRYNCNCQAGGVDATSVDADWLESVAQRISTGWSVLQSALAQTEAERDEALRVKKDAKKLRKQVKAIRKVVAAAKEFGDLLDPDDILYALSSGQK